MASTMDPSSQQQQTWVPYESAKDCSQGFCSIYCPQWCYLIFPPPPPFSFSDDPDDSSSSGGTSFSPLVIAIIGILASAFLLVSYYTIISKYCGCFRRRRRRPDPVAPDDSLADDDAGNQSHRHEAWHAPPSDGLDEALIGKISVYKYRRGEGVVDGSDCSVCLSEFREEESLRLLPKCSHAFHLHCIDTWLRSHSNCPLCRANIVPVNPPPPPPPPPPPVAEEERKEEDVVVEIEDLEEETDSESGDEGGLKEQSEEQVIEIGDEEGAPPPPPLNQQMRRAFSVDWSNRGRVSIADILRESMEDEFMVAKDQGLLVDAGSSSMGRGKNGKGSGARGRSLHCVMSPVAMKRSVSGERLGVNRPAKGRTSVLPL